MHYPFFTTFGQQRLCCWHYWPAPQDVAVSTGCPVSPSGSHTVPVTAPGEPVPVARTPLSISIHPSIRSPTPSTVPFKGQRCAKPLGKHWVGLAAAVCPGEAGEVISKSSRIDVAPGPCRAPEARSRAGHGLQGKGDLPGRRSAHSVFIEKRRTKLSASSEFLISAMLVQFRCPGIYLTLWHSGLF